MRGRDDPNRLGLGPCCECATEERPVVNILMLEYQSPEAGEGCWGCIQCGAPEQGAIAVLCDACLFRLRQERRAPRLACLGTPAEGRRIPTAHLKLAFHDMRQHQGERRELASRAPA
jgi:hypothetical protein